MSERELQGQEVKCSYLETPTRSLGAGEKILYFEQGICSRDGGNCLLNRFQERSDCPDGRGVPHKLHVIKSGELRRRMRQAVTVVITSGNETGIRRLIG